MSAAPVSAREPPEPVRSWFLISTYVTVGLACACLLYAEWTILPEAAVLAVLIAALLVVSWRLEGKWSLPTYGANALALAILALSSLWVVVKLRRPSGGLSENLPLETAVLFYLGPILMVLLPAKMFRPKTVRDVWALHFIGLICLALGCAMADDIVFGALLLVYLLSALWSLALFLIYRERTADPTPDSLPALPRGRQLAAWALPIIVLGLLIFLFTPRSGNIWQLSTGNRPQRETGMSNELAIDLNGTGTLELNRDVVFEVQVEDSAGRPRSDLPATQRWRGQALRYYFDGKWTYALPTQQMPLGPAPTLAAAAAEAPPPPDLPFLGREQLVLTYSIRMRNFSTPFIADPVFVDLAGQVPIITVREDYVQPWRMSPEGQIAPVRPLPRDGGRYKQVTLPARESALGAEMPIEQGHRRANGWKDPVGLRGSGSTVPSLREWTLKLLRRLAATDSGAAEAMAAMRPDGSFPEEYHEPIARALESYFAIGREYKYSLDLTRVDTNIDPILDFLYNTKSGHCNRFAAALTVMLRSLAIPSRIIMGFRGWDAFGEGMYQVRQCYAHSWVEVFVPRRELPPPGGPEVGILGRQSWHWLALDPTPLTDSIEASQEANNRWWNNSSLNGKQLFKDLILNYSPDRRDRAGQLFWDAAQGAVNSLEKALTDDGPAGTRARTAATLTLLVFGLSFFLAVRWLVRRIVGKRRRAIPLPAVTAFHRRLLAILAGQGWKPAPAQTPEEFALTVAPVLSPRPGGRDLADFVCWTTRLFYRVRFGDRPLSRDETDRVESGLTHLAQSLAQRAN
jgi:hypothetical protein